MLSLEELKDNWQLHHGLRLEKHGVITLPRYHSADCYLKWRLDYVFMMESDPELFIYVDSLQVRRELRQSGLATRLLQNLCVANDKSAVPRRIALVAMPSDGGMTIGELEKWYGRRGFEWDKEFLIRRVGDNRIHKVVSKYWRV
jgi:ribosomal protein S18 acetylase RimI-like enzyme